MRCFLPLQSFWFGISVYNWSSKALMGRMKGRKWNHHPGIPGVLNSLKLRYCRRAKHWEQFPHGGVFLSTTLLYTCNNGLDCKMLWGRNHCFFSICTEFSMFVRWHSNNKRSLWHEVKVPYSVMSFEKRASRNQVGAGKTIKSVGS